MNRDAVTSPAQPAALGCWRANYNDPRPHSQLGWKTPTEVAFICRACRDLALRYAEGSAPAPNRANPTIRPNWITLGAKSFWFVQAASAACLRNLHSGVTLPPGFIQS
ncbi:transposase [Bradyrhizobium sp. 150]|nr:transposase [Bradyrhizobium sp. 150]